MKELIKKHAEYHRESSLTCPDCDYLGDVDAEGVCTRCGKQVEICPECFRQMFDADHKCVFNSRQRKERGIKDGVWSIHPSSDAYL